ncbi:uncharacterized protein LOC113510852 [Galleria mellonella]|uniref:Uncharacterized protein LOC113510852 n=1 Tax=Galleria mellonella TaxID=7137 RepID=A0A6J1WAI7_GALME|nr:uncharacterized protein LOC113510852 [Galleria mellonella]
MYTIMNIFIYNLSIYLYCVLSKPQSNLAPTNLLATRIGPCHDVTSTVVTVSEMSLSTRLHDSSLSGEMNVSRDIDNGWTVKALMQKCQDIRNLDTCDYFKSFPVVRNGCKEDDESDEADLYSMLFHRSQPSMSCPIKAGSYNIVNYPIFNEDNYLAVSEAKISTSVFGYTFRLEGFSRNIKIFCIEAYLQLLYIREHNWNQDEAVTSEPSSEEDKRASDEK